MRTRPTATAAFTLVELLAATALFAVLGLLLFEMTRGAADVWNTGERNREVHDRAAAAFDLLSTDLRHLWPGTPGVAEQDARMLGMWVQHDLDGDGADDLRTPALAFSRVLHEERELDWLRRAGDVAGAQGGTDLLEPVGPAQLRATGGVAETVYTVAVLPGEELPSLVRAVRTPVGGAGSLLDPEQLARLDRVLGGAVRVADGVLGLVVEYWGPDTTHWAGEVPAELEPLELERDDEDEADGAGEAVDRVGGGTAGSVALGGEDGGDGGAAGTGASEPGRAFTAWDSTRGLLEHDFPLHRGPRSVLDGRDDMFPQHVRVTLLLDARLPQGRVREDVSRAGRRLPVRGLAFLRDEDAPDHVLVGHEWMAVTGTDGDDALLVERAAFGSLGTDHRAGDAVRVARRFVLTLALPTARENLDR